MTNCDKLKMYTINPKATTKMTKQIIIAYMPQKRYNKIIFKNPKAGRKRGKVNRVPRDK